MLDESHPSVDFDRLLQRRSEDYEEYYNGFANRVLWPVLHYRFDQAEFSRRDLSGYMRVNEHFASELDKLDLAFDPDRSTFEDPTPSVLDGQWHDAATKLDLAKAYQEMGDVEGAREILQEVLHEGDDEQKAEAKTLLSKLA